jgi:endonuclease YncB( thermonuclease family)
VPFPRVVPLLVVSALAMLIASRSSASPPERIVGPATIIDGDTLEIGGRRIRLHGIDAPETAQTCRVEDRPYRCGEEAAFALADEVGRRPVACDPVDSDRYGRVIAVCWLGIEDLNARMVAQGWALAYRRYSDDYALDEETARAARRGLWRGQFEAPWDWRAAQRRRARPEI